MLLLHPSSRPLARLTSSPHLVSLPASLIHLTDSIKALTGKVLDPDSTPLDRLTALREVAEFAQRFKLGGEDKIRVVGGVCEGVSHMCCFMLGDSESLRVSL